jgi:hypothetical protein
MRFLTVAAVAALALAPAAGAQQFRPVKPTTKVQAAPAARASAAIPTLAGKRVKLRSASAQRTPTGAALVGQPAQKGRTKSR